VERVIFQVLVGVLALGWCTAEAQNLYINSGTTNYNPTISTAAPLIENVFIGDGVGAAGSAVLNVNGVQDKIFPNSETHTFFYCKRYMPIYLFGV
jgi:hypothetical protein